MNYYRRWIADYQAKTQHLSMAEEGAYTRLLDFCYAHEGPLPANQKELFRIAKAVSRSDRKAVTNVVEKFFILMHDGYHNSRADEEIGVAKQAIERQREEGRKAAEKRWGKHRSTHEENNGSTHDEKMGQPNGLGYGSTIQPPTSNHQPTSKPKPETTFATSTGTTAPAQPAAKAIPAEPDPQLVATVDALRVTAGVGTDDHAKAGELFAVLKANSCTGTPSDPRILEWVRDGMTPADLRKVIAKARESNAGQLNPAYLNRTMESMALAKNNGDSQGRAWATDDNACDAKASELGITPRPGETYAQLRNRIAATITRRTSEAVK